MQVQAGVVTAAEKLTPGKAAAAGAPTTAVMPGTSNTNNRRGSHYWY